MIKAHSSDFKIILWKHDVKELHHICDKFDRQPFYEYKKSENYTTLIIEKYEYKSRWNYSIETTETA